MIHYRGIVSIISIVIYVLLSPFAAVNALKRSFNSQAPWMLLLAFFILRILGMAFQLAAELADSPNKHLVIGGAICNAIGLGPMLLTTTRLLMQCNACLFAGAVSTQTHRALATFELCTVVSTILAIIGGVQSFDHLETGSGSFEATTIFKAGISIYAASYLCILLAAMVITARSGKIEAASDSSIPHFRFAVASIMVAVMILLVRIIYSLLSVFGHDAAFSPFNGNETIQLCMETIEEYLISMLYLSAGYISGTIQLVYTLPLTKENGAKGHRIGRILRYFPLIHWFVR